MPADAPCAGTHRRRRTVDRASRGTHLGRSRRRGRPLSLPAGHACSARIASLVCRSVLCCPSLGEPLATSRARAGGVSRHAHARVVSKPATPDPTTGPRAAVPTTVAAAFFNCVPPATLPGQEGLSFARCSITWPSVGLAERQRSPFISTRLAWLHELSVCCHAGCASCAAPAAPTRVTAHASHFTSASSHSLNTRADLGGQQRRSGEDVGSLASAPPPPRLASRILPSRPTPTYHATRNLLLRFASFASPQAALASFHTSLPCSYFPLHPPPPHPPPPRARARARACARARARAWPAPAPAPAPATPPRPSPQSPPPPPSSPSPPAPAQYAPPSPAPRTRTPCTSAPDWLPHG